MTPQPTTPRLRISRCLACRYAFTYKLIHGFCIECAPKHLPQHDWQPTLLGLLPSYFETRNRVWQCEKCGKHLTRRYASHRQGWVVPKTWYAPCAPARRSQ